MSAGQLPPPGTVLRKYDRHGTVRCEAVVGEGGQVIYRGVTYSSISAAAKAAAGDIGLAARSCDGYAFFGLKGRADATPRAPRPASAPRPGDAATALPLPLPVRWDDLPPAQPSANLNEIAAVISAPVAPALQGVYTRDGGAEHVLVRTAAPPTSIEPVAKRAPLTDEIVAETVFNHGKHGRADASGAPLDSDCACRGTTREKTCAESGCGFCRAAQMAQARAEFDARVRDGRIEVSGEFRESPPIAAPEPITLDIDAPSLVDLKQRGAELVQALDDLAGAGARQALDFAYGNLACSTNHKPDRETFRRLWAERKLPAKEFDAWAASRTWWDREPVDDRLLPERYGELCVLHGKPVQYNIGDGLRCVDCLSQELVDKVPDEAKETVPSAPAVTDPASAITAAPACNMIVGHKADFDHDKEGRVVGVEPGEEIECGKPAVKQATGDPGTRLCAKCAIVWEADRLGELEPIAIDPAGATVADLAPIIDEQARVDSARAEATLMFEQDPPTAVLTIAPPVPPVVDAALERLHAEADVVEATAANMFRELDDRSAQENLPALLASTVDPRDVLGQRVREVWVAWAREVSAPKAPWLLPWAELAESYREVDRRIGEALFKMGVEAEEFTTRITAASVHSTLDEIRDTLFDAVEGDVDPDERFIDTLKRIVRERDTARASKRAEAAPSETREPAFTLGEVMTILGNLVGDQVKCGACMEVAFTGATTSAHECAKRRRVLGSITRHEPDEIEKILNRWASRAREDYNLSDEARAVLQACFKEMAEAYVGPDPTDVDQGSAPEGSPAALASSTEGERRQDADAVGTAQMAGFLPLRQLESTGPAPTPDQFAPCPGATCPVAGMAHAHEPSRPIQAGPQPAAVDEDGVASER